MNEVEKMYENAEIKYSHCRCALKPEYCKYQKCLDCDCYFVVPFTAEKQLELIKWLCQNTYRNYIHFRYERDINNWKMECNMIGLREYGSFEECFAGLINNLWQDLTDAEKAQIKEILE